MRGKRKYADHRGFLTLTNGEYGRTIHGEWHACSPNGDHGTLPDEIVVEHPDQTISILGAVVIDDYFESQWEGYLIRGVWIEKRKEP